MIWLVEDFGLLSVILRAMILTLQTLTVGGILYTAVVVQRSQAEPLRRCRRWITRFALALAAAGALYVLTDSAILVVSMDLPLRSLPGADYFLSGSLIVLLSLAIAWSANRPSHTAPWLLPLLAAALMVNTVFTSHAVSRLNHRLLLSALTLLHQGAAAAWLGGLAFLMLTLPSPALHLNEARPLLRRFGTVAMSGVAGLIVSGILLSVFYVGSASALYGTAYGVMVLFKAALLLLMVLLGAINFSIARDGGFARSTLALLGRMSELELAVGFAVLLTAASLTSQPPGVDLVAGRLTAGEIAVHFRPAWPPLHHPPLETLAPATPLEESVRTPDNLERAAAHTNRDPDLAWSEFEHNWSGIFLTIIGLGGLISAFPRGRWARWWPLVFFVLAIFLMVFSDPENWPLGPISYWKSFSDPEVLQHRVFFSLLIVYGAFEIGVQTGRLRSRWAALVFPTMVAFGASGLLLHSHALGNVRLELLAEISHTTIGILGVLCGGVRWFEIWTRADSDRMAGNARLRRAAGVAACVWPLCLVAIGLVLFNYREG